MTAGDPKSGTTSADRGCWKGPAFGGHLASGLPMRVPLLSRAADVDELGDMTVRRNCGVKGSAMAGVMLAGLVAAGCTHQPASPRRASVESCIQFGISAIKHHVTVTSVPAACQGLTRAQVNFAAGSALHAMAAAAHGKARQRERAAKLSPLLAHLVTTVPGQRSRPPASAPARPGSHRR